jgi:CopG family transcriptional regulator, nickel-responsive regulator
MRWFRPQPINTTMERRIDQGRSLRLSIQKLEVTYGRDASNYGFRTLMIDTNFYFVIHGSRRIRMHHLSRFGVSLEEDLLAAFDLSIGGMGYQNRSEAIRDLIRDHLIQKKVGQGDTEVIGVVTLVYDHRVHRLSDILADMQHKAEVAVNASLHIHLDEHNCLEVIVIRGRGDKVHEISGKLIATKGVQNGKLVTTTPELKH